MIPQSETELIEFKEKLTDSLEKEVVAFLNAKGGCIYIGVKDNGDIAGISDIDKIQLQVKDRLINCISPAILSFFTMRTEYIDGKAVLKISIKEGVEKPYYIKSKGLSESGAFIRIGSSAQPMSREMIYSLINKTFPKSLTVIESPEQELTFAELFIHYRRFNKPLNDNTFAKTLNFLTKDGKYNYLAYLMADNNQVSVRFARFNDSGERFELIEKGIEYGFGCIITAIQRVLDRFEIENITLSKLTGAAHRIDKRLVDNKCLREVIINAFAHNDYSYGMLPIFEVFQNRFAVRSYGGLVPQLTIEDFFLGVSALRNQELMRILKDVELVEALGIGIREITKVYDRNIFQFTDTTLYVQLPFDSEVMASMGKRKEERKENSKEKTIDLMKINPKITIDDISIHTGLSVGGTKKIIKQLKNEGIITRKGTKKEGQWIIEETAGKVDNKVDNKVRERNKNIEKIVQLMKTNPQITTTNMSIHTGLSISGTEKIIKQLKLDGKIFREGSKKEGQWIVE